MSKYVLLLVTTALNSPDYYLFNAAAIWLIIQCERKDTQPVFHVFIDNRNLTKSAGFVARI